MALYPYLYLKDYKYLEKKQTSRKKEVTLIAFGLLLGIFISQASRSRLNPVLISPLPAETSELNSNVFLTPTTKPIAEDNTPTVTIGFTPTPTLVPEISPLPIKNLKNEYTIALLGDSMTDTAGIGYPILQTKLNIYYPNIKFNILNYGVGARDLESGLQRLTNNYEYLGRKIPSLLSQNPDIIFIESFAYNHWSKSQSDLDKQWLTLSKIVDTIKAYSSAKIVFLSTIAPDSKYYAKGVKDIIWTEEERNEQAETVKIYLENHLKFAKGENIPFIDAYHLSLDQSHEGKLEYINSTDLLHPSNSGHELVANLIASWIFNNLQ